MTIGELHQDESVRRREFPVCEKGVFLAHAGVSPIPRRVGEAMACYISACAQGDQENVLPRGLTLETRKLAAELLECLPEEIALIGPTSVGLSMVANGLDWRAGDNVVFYGDDYPANAVPWMALERQKVELRGIQPKQLGLITLKEIEPLVDKRTRLVALASAHFISGYRTDLKAIGQLVKLRGALFCVDGIQTLGALRTPATHADFLAADSHKWLLGPCSAGILFVRREAREKLRPILLGADNVNCKNYITPQTIEFRPHAGRYEPGSPNFVGIVGLHAALKLLKECGHLEIEKTALEHTRYLRDGLRKRDYALACEADDGLSGITSFRRNGADMGALHCKLTKANITTSLRQTREGKQWIRCSPHFYNTREELDRLLNLVGDKK